ncbi:MAG: hypothetical protein JRN51_10125, partial [Nitrososphaerota archaeon]|nr:hypothetical protein [Nitrososphaerota archaeon]
AATLEAEWNAKLNALVQAQDDYGRQLRCRFQTTLGDECEADPFHHISVDAPTFGARYKCI